MPSYVNEPQLISESQQRYEIRSMTMTIQPRGNVTRRHYRWQLAGSAHRRARREQLFARPEQHTPNRRNAAKAFNSCSNFLTRP
jgi:hypothetical protein